MSKLDIELSNKSNKYYLKNKLALITGASKGIGKSIALTFAKNGADLILLGRNEKLLQEVKEEVQTCNKSASDKNKQCQIVVCDLQDTANLLKKLENLFTDNSCPDILINNAGAFAVDSINHKDSKIWQDTVAVHLTAAYELSCFFSKFMINKNWGRIVNISSISAEGEKYALSYSTAKAGLIGLSKALALELAKFDITVNAICPGWVETDMAIKQLKDIEWCKLNNISPEQSLDIAKFSIPQERLLQAEEIAHLAAFLCSPEAKGITGQSINICGGLSLT